MFNLLHSSMNQQLSEKHLCNQSSLSRGPKSNVSCQGESMIHVAVGKKTCLEPQVLNPVILTIDSVAQLVS